MAGVLDGLATTVVSTIEAMSVSFTANGNSYTSTVNAFWPAPKDLDGPGPWAVIELPEITRTALDTPESEIGSTDWFVSFPVVFYFPLDNATYAQEQAVNTVEAWVKAVDTATWINNQTLLDAKVTKTGPPAIEADQQNALIVYETLLEIYKLV